MRKFEIAKMVFVSNRGDNFEFTMKKMVNPDYFICRDSGSHKLGSDIPEISASCKLVNGATLCKASSTNLEEAVNSYLEEDASEQYLVGFDLVDADNYKVLQMDKSEMKNFLMTNAKMDTASKKNGGCKTLRLLMRSEGVQRRAWER